MEEDCLCKVYSIIYSNCVCDCAIVWFIDNYFYQSIHLGGKKFYLYFKLPGQKTQKGRFSYNQNERNKNKKTKQKQNKNKPKQKQTKETNAQTTKLTKINIYKV